MFRRVLSGALFAVLLGALSLPHAFGQDGSAVRLSLKDCRTMALANNLDLVSAKKNPAIEEQQVEKTLAPFDPVVQAGLNYQDADGDETIRDRTSFQTNEGTSESEVWRGDISFGQLLKFGGDYSLTYNYTDIDASARQIQAATGFLTQSDFTQEIYGLTLNYDMPLLKGLGKEVNMEAVILARSRRDISLEDLKLSAIQTVQAVEDAYWNVLAARAAVRISKLALERAEDLLELNKKKVEVGTLAPIEITRAEAGVSSQVEAVIVSETTLENAEDALLQLLAAPDDDPMWGQSLDLTDRPSFVPVSVDLKSAIDDALENRSEIFTARRNLRDSELSERVAKRRQRHQLDLSTSITPDQQDDTDRLLATLAPPGIPPSNTTTDAEDTNWSVGLRYTWALRNRTSKADYVIARLNREKSDIAVSNVEQDVRVEVRTAVREIESGTKRVEAARQNVVLQQKNLEAEQKKFDNGMSTSFEVLEFQNDLADAERNEVVARLDYLRALTELERAKGTLLESRNLKIDMD